MIQSETTTRILVNFRTDCMATKIFSDQGLHISPTANMQNVYGMNLDIRKSRFSGHWLAGCYAEKNVNS